MAFVGWTNRIPNLLHGAAAKRDMAALTLPDAGDPDLAHASIDGLFPATSDEVPPAMQLTSNDILRGEKSGVPAGNVHSSATALERSGPWPLFVTFAGRWIGALRQKKEAVLFWRYCSSCVA